MVLKTILYLTWVVVIEFYLSDMVTGQIPYSYASGRDLDAVNRRHAAFQAAKGAGASSEELQKICGPLRLTPGTTNYCTTKIGRPRDSETASCDVYCCLAGEKTGNCKTRVGVKVDAGKVAAVIGGSQTSTSDVLAAIPSLVQLSSSCLCLNNDKDVKCGLDGSFWGIRCPDRSACWRKCCREDRAGGRCRGLFNLRCRCYD